MAKASAVFSGGLVRISILPSPSRPPVVPDKEKEKENQTSNDTEFSIAKQVIVKAQAWEEAPDDHICMSPRLARTLGINGVGDLARHMLFIVFANSRVTPSGSPVKKPPSKLIYHPFSSNLSSDKSNALRLGGDKARQKEESNAKDKEASAILHRSLKHIFNSPITESMRVFPETNSPKGGIISFQGHTGEWFQPRTQQDFTISMGREIPDVTSAAPSFSTPTPKIVSIDKLLNKAGKTLCRNGSVLVCGGRGAGKSATLLELSNRMHTHLVRTTPPI